MTQEATTRKTVTIVGSGKRVRETALPALRRVPELFEVRGVFARTAKELAAEGQRYGVRPLEELTDDDVRSSDLVYLAVTKDAVPSVLERLTAAGPAAVELLIDTPVVRFKHFHHVDALSRFRSAWVAEDCVFLPWLETVRGAVEAGAIGELRAALFFQSAYAYHGVATAKALLGSRRVRSARRESLGHTFGVRRLRLANGTRATVVEPRDYAAGRLVVTGTGGSISDYPLTGERNLLLEPIADGDACTGFRAGEHTTELAPAEIELTRGDPAGASVTARMDAMKRVGFLRLLKAVHAGQGAYPVADAVDDMVVDYHLEKVGRYLANPFTSSRSPLARAAIKVLTRAAR